jgi:Uma2 family endonuclease
MSRVIAQRADNIGPRPTGIRMTYDQFLDWVQPGVHAEWVDGEVVMMAPVGRAHVRLHLFLLRLIGDYLEHRPLGEITFDPFNMKTGDDLPGRAPDILFVAKKNLKRLKDNHLQGPADMVIEIISPGSVGVDRGDKFYEYESGGVGEYWILDPFRKRADFYRRDNAGTLQLVPPDDQQIYRCRAIKGFWVDVRWFWRFPFPTLRSIRKQWKLENDQ